MNLNKSRVVRAVVAVALSGALFAIPHSSAAAAPVTPIPGTVKRFPMKPRGVDAAVAKAHGFRVVKGAGGIDVAVPTPSAKNPDGSPYKASPRAITPDDVVESDCGDSFLWIHPVGGYNVELETGFEDLIHDAVSYYWSVTRTDLYGSDDYSWGGGLNFRDSWTGEWDFNAGGPTTEYAVVNSVSDAILWDGTICVAQGASDVEPVV